MTDSGLIDKIKYHKKKFKREAIRRHGSIAWQDAIYAGAGVTLGDIRAMFGPHPEDVRIEAYQKIANFLGFTITSRLGKPPSEGEERGI